jgi:site-specific recombinase XerD
MSPARRRMDTMQERYDQALEYCHDKHLPSSAPRPRPTGDWPPENVALLERYAVWLSGGGASEQVIRTIYIPMAGHTLGIALKPHPQLDLESDLQPALDYVIAKGAGPDWIKVSRNSLAKFRRFLIHERGLLEPKKRRKQPDLPIAGLPAWLVCALQRFQTVYQHNWRQARLDENIRRFWCSHLSTWRFLCQECGVLELPDLLRKHLYAYAEHRLNLGKAVSTINADLRNFHSFMLFLQEEGSVIPQALLRLHGLKQPERLPRYITDDQVHALRDDFENQVSLARHPHQRRDSLLSRAIFYLLWQCGLRKGEVEELRLEDLDLPKRMLTVRNGKGMKDRSVYLTDTAVRALTTYLAVRGMGPTDHVFLYRHQPLSKDLIYGRLKIAGLRLGFPVSAHRLRHTAATQLLNAGCPVTSIQKLLGHKKLNSTMIYARAHDKTVENDFFTAMQRIEARLELVPEPALSERCQLLSLAEQLFQPELSVDVRFHIAAQMCSLLDPALPTPADWIPPPGSPILVDVQFT